jgi:hypothetical protein
MTFGSLFAGIGGVDWPQDYRERQAMTCWTTERVGARCEDCGEIPKECHVVSEETIVRFKCKEHCGVHSPPPAEWSAEAQTIAGEQKGLFE